MRVALVFPACSRRGGVERIMWEAANHLAGRHEVMVIAREAEELPAAVRHLPVGGTGGGVLAPVHFRRAAAPVVASSGADVVVAYGNECPPADVYVINSVTRAWLATAGPVEVRGITLPGWSRYLMPQHLVGLGIERVYYAGAKGTHLVPCAAQVTTDLSRLYGLAGTPATVVHNGFSPAEFSPERRLRSRVAQRQALGYGDGEVVLLMVANEWRRKGLAVVLEAMAQVGDPSLRLLLAGKVAPDAFLDRVTDRGLRSRIRYVGASNDVGQLHAAADLFVMPTEYEAFSLAIVEALASGLPVLTTSVPGAGDTIVPGVNGLLLRDPHDVDALADMLRQGLNQPMRDRWSEAAPDTVVEYRWDRLMATFEEVLEGVVDKKAFGG